MRVPRPLVLAGLAATVAGLGVAAIAERPRTHLVTVALPDGTVRTIRTTGATPPRVVLVADPFAGLDAMMAMMDAQTDALLRQVAATPATPPGGVTIANVAAAPAGARTSYTSTVIVNGKACTTSVESVSQGAGRQPTMLRKVSGDGCTTAVTTPAAPTAATLPAPPGRRRRRSWRRTRSEPAAGSVQIVAACLGQPEDRHHQRHRHHREGVPQARERIARSRNDILADERQESAEIARPDMIGIDIEL